MEASEIFDQVNQIMIEEFEVEPDAIKPEAKLGDDLGLDSLDAVDLVVLIEKKFGVRIQEEEARKMRILKDIYDYIDEKLS